MVSPAPSRIPSSANTAAPIGCINASSGHNASARSSTRGSDVNARGITPRNAISVTPIPNPPSTDSSIIRFADAQAA